MGLSIHYSATLKNACVLTELIDQVAELAIALDWRWTILSTPRLSGIIVNPPNCEPLLLCFTPDGKSCGPGYFIQGGIPEADNSMVHVKTSAAGPEIHKALIDLLAYLSRTYFQEIRVYDEGRYWETRDFNILSSYFEVDTKEQDMRNHSPDGSLLPVVYPVI